MDIFLSESEAKQRFRKVLSEVKEGDRVIITRRGKPTAAVIDFERLQLLTELARLCKIPSRLVTSALRMTIFVPAASID